MKVVLVEDEKPAREKLRNYLHEFPGTISILAELGSVSEAQKWFTTHSIPDLVFLDIQLSDGTPFHLLANKIISCPVIFVTAYDKYILDVLHYHSIGYILKPVKKEKLLQAIHKYEEFKRFFQSNIEQFLNSWNSGKTHKERIVARKGNHSLLLNSKDISYFFTEHKVVFIVSKDGVKYVVDYNLSELESMLSREEFFRVNRKFIVHIDAIVKFRSYSKGRIEVELLQPPAEEVIISQENAQNFRNWINR